MATAYISPERLSFNYQLIQIKAGIKTYFKLLVDILKERESELLSELDELASSHKREKDQQKQSLSEIEVMLKQTQENIHSNVLKGTKFGIVKMLEQQKRDIEFKLICKSILFNFDDTLFGKIRCFGKINITNQPIVEYTDKIRPVVCVGGAGANEGQFNHPSGVSVDYTTDNIYIVDQCNNRVQVYGKEGKYLFKFGDRGKTGKMNRPFTIAISKEKVFVSQTECILVYSLDGTFLERIGGRGSGDGQFLSPFGIAINEDNEDIYVGDLKVNRVQVFSKQYSFVSQFGNGILHLPRDIKLTKNNIFVLCEDYPFLFTFDYNLTLVSNVIYNSISDYFSRPFSLEIDGAGKLIIADFKCIFIFNPRGELLHRLISDVARPSGVALDSQRRIIVVDFNHRLLIF